MKIIAYHYVRNLAGAQYQGLNALSVDGFCYQLDWLKEHFNVIDPSDIKEMVANNEPLREKDCWLTFDDGYIDHYQSVLPELEKRNLKGSFFPSNQSLFGRDILLPNKLHFVISEVNSLDIIFEEVKSFFHKEALYEIYGEWDSFISQIDCYGKYDNKQCTLLKRLLQRELKSQHALRIVNSMFDKYVTENHEEFHKKLYMSVDNIRHIHSLGHEIGIHGDTHGWLTYMDRAEQLKEIQTSLLELQSLKVIEDKWTMCYPYGAYNNETLSILSDLGATLAVSVGCKITSENDNVFELKRFDTNDFPQCRD